MYDGLNCIYFFFDISPKSHRDIAEKVLRYRRKGIGISPKGASCFAEEAMIMRFQADLDPILAFFRCCEVLKSR